jgi:hypothetical protein
MAAADAEGALLGDAAAVAAGLGVETGALEGLGDAAVEQAAIATASIGARRVMDRFMTGWIPFSALWRWCPSAVRTFHSI